MLRYDFRRKMTITLLLEILKNTLAGIYSTGQRGYAPGVRYPADVDLHFPLIYFVTNSLPVTGSLACAVKQTRYENFLPHFKRKVPARARPGNPKYNPA
jgi:hypothetical protein